MAADIERLTRDLAEETTRLMGVLETLPEPSWRLPTPAVGWSVADQVSHLAHFDHEAVRAITEPSEFLATLDAMANGVDSMTDAIAKQYRDVPVPELRRFFREERDRLMSISRHADPTVRVVWYGPAMSLASFITARIMETWAHGQDIYDAVGVAPREGPGLFHVCFIGSRAFANSFTANGLSVPRESVRIELTTPEGASIDFGPPDASERIAGPAVDFALRVTQRRHLDDLSLAITGPVALAWMEVAQAFAGPPGSGRSPLGR